MRHFQSSGILFLAVVVLVSATSSVFATDYFLTIGGGYNPSGNQASLEANVLFFQKILDEKHHGTRTHDVFFADGKDSGADLQVLAKKSATPDLPVTALLASLHRRRETQQIEYRDHQVPNVAGPTDPVLVRSRIESIAKDAKQGDRVIVYVTAHGSPGRKEESHNTTIDCWNEKRITAREFAKWLGGIPQDVPVVMVMAQCYCGGFAHTIFDDLTESKGLVPQLRAGFFAQQHNLPAAGCRPDIDNEEEFSSYFWGAIVGRSRNGIPVEKCDIDGNDVVSFAEAFAHAMIAEQAIDIPLRTSEVLLRTYSRLPGKSSSDDAVPSALEPSNADLQLTSMSGTLDALVDDARPVSRYIVVELSRLLGFTLQDDVASVTSAYDELRRTGRTTRGPRQGPGAGGPQGRRPGSGRREFLQQIADKWPALADADHWDESILLRPDHQEELFAEIKELPGWKSFDERRRQMQTSGEQSLRNEVRDVKFRRLINTLEGIVLEKNLSKTATPQIIDRYRRLIELEESALDPAAVR